MSLLLLLFLLLIVNYSRQITINNDSVAIFRSKFDQKFQEVCLKYPFVQKYQQSLQTPHDKYLIFVFHEQGQRAGFNGGLGDRLAGLITAVAFAIRTNRTFLIQGDHAFETAFQPHSTSVNQSMTWDSWDWAGWKREYSASMIKLPCVNPRPSNTKCALDYNHYESYKVIKLYANRVYMCRWIIKADLNLAEELMQTLGISSKSNLYEVAGCLMRLVLSPSDTMIQTALHLLEEERGKQTPAVSSIVFSKMVAVHFRCGDSSFSGNSQEKPNPQCFYTDVNEWKGTSFQDDFSKDSTLDLATCANKLLSEKKTDNINNQSNTSAILYIASDYAPSAQQIMNMSHWKNIISPTKRCHIDIQGGSDCAISTLAQWFILANSDYIITQALQKTENNPFDDKAYLKVLHEQKAPISAFSRYALIYSLQVDGLRYGIECDRSVDTYQLAHQTHGNWICDPLTFF